MDKSNVKNNVELFRKTLIRQGVEKEIITKRCNQFKNTALSMGLNYNPQYVFGGITGDNKDVSVPYGDKEFNKDVERLLLEWEIKDTLIAEFDRFINRFRY